MQNMTVIYQFPSYVANVMEIIGDGEWLVHNFNIDIHSEALNLAGYLYNTEFDGSSYTVCVDLNVFQFLVNAVKKDVPKDIYRLAIAYLAFFQTAGIEVDPTYAVYEKVNHQPERAREGVEDLDIFHQLNNMPTNQLAMYAIGESNQIILQNSLGSTDVDHMEAELTRYRRLKEWPSLYTIVLAIVEIEFDGSIPRRKKLASFIDWSFREFRNSLPGFVFAISVLSHQKLGRAMKFDPSKPVDKRRAALENMTWDLYYMRQYFERWVKRPAGAETVFLTSDKAFAHILRLSIDVQKAHNIQPLEQYISGLDQQLFSYVLNPENYPHDRAYMSERWGQEYRDEIAAKLERKLLGP